MSSSRKRAPSDSICSFTAERTSKACTTAPEPARRGDRLQPGHAGAQHQHLGRAHGARGGGQHREEARQLLGGDQRGAVAADRGLRGERVHRLRARDARDRLHREAGDARRRPAPARCPPAVSGWRKPISTEPCASRPISSGRRRRDLGHHLAREAVAELGAGLLVGRVGEVRAPRRRRPRPSPRRRLGRAARPPRARAPPGARRSRFPWVQRRSSLAATRGHLVGPRGRGMLAEPAAERGVGARVRAVPLRRRARQLALASALLALAAPAAGIASPSAKPSVPACALGTSAADLRGFFAAELGRAERRYSSSRRARRRFAAAAAAYVYGLAPVALSETTQRFPREPAGEHRRAGGPDGPHRRAPEQRHHLHGRAPGAVRGRARCSTCPTRAGRYYVIQLLDAYSNTFAYVGRRTTGTRPGSYAIVPPGFDGELPPACERIQSPTQARLGARAHARAAPPPTCRRRGADGGYRSRRSTPGPRAAPGPARARRLPDARAVDAADRARLLRRARRGPAQRPGRRRATPARCARSRAPGSRAATRLARGHVRADGELGAGARIVRRAERRANRFGARRNNGWVLPGPYVGAYGATTAAAR